MIVAFQLLCFIFTACVDTLFDSNGILDYPTTSLYENNLNCTWNFMAPSGLVVEITFNDIDLEPEQNGVCFDTITVSTMALLGYQS